MGIFSKKPGGTTVGNALRMIGKQASKAIAGYTGINLPLGEGLNKIEVGQTKTNQQLLDEQDMAARGLYPAPAKKPISFGIGIDARTGMETPVSQFVNNLRGSAQGTNSLMKFLPIAIIAALGLLFYSVMKKK